MIRIAKVIIATVRLFKGLTYAAVYYGSIEPHVFTTELNVFSEAVKRAFKDQFSEKFAVLIMFSNN